MSKVDYTFKSYVLREHQDLLRLERQASLYNYECYLLNSLGVIPSFPNKNRITYSDLKDKVVNDGLVQEFKECQRINTSYYKRKTRLQKRVSYILSSGQSIFLTLTFNDKTLENSTPLQRRVYVSRFLKSFNSCYVANIDFGKTNHREHYHALIRCDKVSRDNWSKFGNINFERIRNNNVVKLSKYICKLTNHAIKETTKRSALLYSR